MKKYEATWSSLKTHTVPPWYDRCKFGIFIHWGLYSVPAFAPSTWELGEVPVDENWFCNNPYGEWYQNSVRVGKGPTYEHHLKTYGKDFPYEGFADLWHAENFHPEEWADLFRESGAGYVVMVAKHHDGFSLFPSRYSHFTSMEMGPGRDLVGELTTAVREKNLKMGLYYSGIIDWQYAGDPILTETDNFDKACRTTAYSTYAFNQAMELIDRYRPSVFWNDIGWPLQGVDRLPELLAHYYNTVPDGVVNDRFNGLFWDFRTREYQQGEASRTEKWEMCRGMGLSFGYNQAEHASLLLSSNEILSLLIETVSCNGNLLLNIGPKADGTIPEEQCQRLREVGQWLKENGDAIYNTHGSPLENFVCESGTKVFFTENTDTVFVLIDKCAGPAETIAVKDARGLPAPVRSTADVSLEASTEILKITLPCCDKKKPPIVVALKKSL